MLAADAGIGTADFIAQIEASDLTTATSAPTYAEEILGPGLPPTIGDRTTRPNPVDITGHITVRPHRS